MVLTTSQLPLWIQWLAALSPVATGIGTATIAGIVAFIAYRQWKTANAKLALDLFEKRLAVFSDASEAARLVSGHDGAKNNEAWQYALSAWRASTFLFQKELRDHLELLLDEIGSIRAAEEMMEVREDEPTWQKNHATKWDGVKKVARLQKELPDKFAPYMRMDQKI